MRTSNRKHLNSGIYERIGTIQMSAAERSATIAAHEEGEQIAEAILSAAHVLRLLVTLPNLKPSFKH